MPEHDHDAIDDLDMKLRQARRDWAGAAGDGDEAAPREEARKIEAERRQLAEHFAQQMFRATQADPGVRATRCS